MEDTELVIDPTVVFATGGSQVIIDGVKSRISKFTPDATTPNGRKEIASFAYKIAKEKSRVDSIGEEYASDLKSKVKVIDSERKKIRDGLDFLKEEVRKPVTEFEQREEKRIATIKAHLDDLAKISDFLETQNSSIDDLQSRLKRLEMSNFNEWDEFQSMADTIRADGAKRLREQIEAATKREADRIELERLRAAEAERAKKDHDEKVAAEAAAKAKREAEAKAAAEMAAAEAATAKAKKEAEDAKAAVVAAEKKAKDDAIAAAAAAEAATAKAVEDEKRRAAAAAKAEAEAEETRKQNKAHQAAINNAAVAALVDAGLSHEDAKKAVVAIVSGKVPNVTVRY